MTPKQAAFAREYLVDLNGAAAAVRAGYSAKAGKVMALKLLANEAVQATIQAAMNKRAAKVELKADRVLLELTHTAFYDPADFATDEVEVNGPRDIKRLPESVRRAIVGWSWDRAGNFTLKLADKLGALDKLGRHLKLFTDKVEHTGRDGAAIEVIDASAAAFDRRIAALVERFAGAGHHGGDVAGGEGAA